MISLLSFLCKNDTFKSIIFYDNGVHNLWSRQSSNHFSSFSRSRNHSSNWIPLAHRLFFPFNHNESVLFRRCTKGNWTFFIIQQQSSRHFHSRCAHSIRIEPIQSLYLVHAARQRIIPVYRYDDTPPLSVNSLRRNCFSMAYKKTAPNKTSSLLKCHRCRRFAIVCVHVPYFISFCLQIHKLSQHSAAYSST